jgi:hypothetical protein
VSTTTVDENGNPTQELMRPQFGTGDMRGIVTFEDAMALMQSAGISVDDAAEAIGDGFVLLEDKAKLQDVPCLFMTWSFSPGEYGNGEYVTARVVAKLDNGTVAKYVLNDGSTGIYKQLREYTDMSGKLGGLAAHGGLKVSNYTKDIFNPKTGKEEPTAATTVYIDTSKK